MQNIMQLDNGYHANMRKRKASEAFGGEFDYLYGIVSTSKLRRWDYFAKYDMDKKLYLYPQS